MTPEVASVVIAVTTTWEGASAQEIETDVIEPQEERLGNLSGLVQMTSTSQAGQGQIRLEFGPGGSETVDVGPGEFFGEIRPVSTLVQVAALIDPQMLIEIEADAVLDRE